VDLTLLALVPGLSFEVSDGSTHEAYRWV